MQIRTKSGREGVKYWVKFARGSRFNLGERKDSFQGDDKGKKMGGEGKKDLSKEREKEGPRKGWRRGGEEWKTRMGGDLGMSSANPGLQGNWGGSVKNIPTRKG